MVFRKYERMLSQMDKYRQESEVISISFIYSYEEFCYSKKGLIECYYNVFPKVQDSLLKLKTGNLYSNTKHFIKYLPPIRLYLQLPYDYPTQNAPKFNIMTSWLTCWQISSICEKLHEIWLNNKGEEILFLWFEFLKRDLLHFLQIKDTLDISLLYSMYYNVSNSFQLNWTYKCNARVVYNLLFFDPLQFLISYDKQQRETEFKKNVHSCIICFEIYLGEKCVELENCNHIYCKKCIEQYITVKINENNVHAITCPIFDCNDIIDINKIKTLCPHLFPKYENILLQLTLCSMENLIVCPKKKCQFPFFTQSNSEMAICYKCDYSFCLYCYKSYHGAELCFLKPQNLEDLINKYRNSDKNERYELTKKFGRRLIETLVEKYLTTEYLNKSTKLCPNCQARIQKTSGCNKVNCSYCKTNFCWLCGMKINTLNPYDHFLDVGKCYGLLFQ